MGVALLGYSGSVYIQGSRPLLQRVDGWRVLRDGVGGGKGGGGYGRRVRSDDSQFRPLHALSVLGKFQLPGVSVSKSSSLSSIS